MADDLRDPELVIELSSGTATIQGEPVKLPLREFRLLAALAERVGEAIDVPDLMTAVWRQDSEWTSKGELYVLVSKLRRILNEHDDFGHNIRNRRGFGYTLELGADQVLVVESLRRNEADARLAVGSGGAEDAPEDESLEVDSPEHPVETSLEAAPSPVAVRGTSRSQASRVLAAAALVLTLAAGSWSAGYALSRGRTAAPAPEPQEDVATEPQDMERAEETNKPPRREPNKRKSQRRPSASPSPRRGSPKKERSTSETIEVAAPATSRERSSGGAPAEVTGQPSRGSRKAPRKPPPPPQLPPAPTHYLYHLVNRQTGDHYVTTSPSAASDHQAMGYEGGPIARVYTYQEDGTKAISTNGGSAFVFITAAPKTEPASSVVPLWYSTDGSGDFFYTTSESEAKRSGWQGSVIGYGRSL